MAIKDEYLKEAIKKIQAPNVLINMVSKRARQLKLGSKPMVQSLERLSPENIALKEIIEGHLTHRLPTDVRLEDESTLEVEVATKVEAAEPQIARVASE